MPAESAPPLPPSTSPSGSAEGLFSLRGRRALITGSGQGIGFTLARGLGEAGAELVLNDLDPARLELAVTTLRNAGLVVTGRCFDVTQADAINSAMADLERTTG